MARFTRTVPARFIGYDKKRGAARIQLDKGDFRPDTRIPGEPAPAAKLFHNPGAPGGRVTSVKPIPGGGAVVSIDVADNESLLDRLVRGQIEVDASFAHDGAGGSQRAGEVKLVLVT